MKILLIAGHGNGDPGAVGNGYKEADLTREVVNLLKPTLSKYATVDIADTSVNWYASRSRLNVKGYDYVLEIHFNAIKAETVSDGATKGVEIYVTETEKGITVEENILKHISALGLRNRGVKRKNYSVIATAKNQGVSAALLEVCFIDDIDDMRIYTTKKNDIINAITKGIADGFGLSKSELKTETKPETKTDASAWAAASFEKATANGILDGSNPQGNVTREMLAVILDRCGVLDK